MYSKLSRLRRRVATRLKTVVFPRRQHPRLYLATDVRVEGHDFTFMARSVQLGTEGMSLQYAGQLSTAQPVLLAFSLPSGAAVEVGAVVWWKTKELVGLRFDPRDHNPAIREWILRAVPTLPARGSATASATFSVRGRPAPRRFGNVEFQEEKTT